MDSVIPTTDAPVDVMTREHDELRKIIRELDAAVMGTSGDDIRDETAARVVKAGKWLTEWMPAHYHHEETTIFPDLEKIGAAHFEVAQELKRQHVELRIQLARFRETVLKIEAGDRSRPVTDIVKTEGAALVRFMKSHLAFEEDAFDVLRNVK